MNIHIHPVRLDHASRILKSLGSAGRSGCFRARAFIGAGEEKRYDLQDAQGTVRVQLFNRNSERLSSFFRKVLATMQWTRKVTSYASSLRASCINVHGLSTLAVGVKLKRRHGCKLIYDTHELESKALAIRGVRRLYSERLERSLIRHCDAVICVSHGIADWYASHYGIARPLVVRNVPDRRAQLVAKTAGTLRQRFAVPADALIFLYVGELKAGRQVEQFIDVFTHQSPDRQLVFLGHGELEDAVRQAAARCNNIHYHPPVPPNEVLGYSAQADIGLVGVENRCLSYYLSLPNKLFECLAAGVPVIVPDMPEMRRVIDDHQCGWSWSGEAAGLAALIQRLSRDEIKTRRERARAAGAELCWEKEEQQLLRLYQGLVGPAKRSEANSPAGNGVESDGAMAQWT